MSNPRSRFVLKPSSLSQHTENFNKNLEKVEAPKIESFELIKPPTIINTNNLNKKSNFIIISIIIIINYFN